MQRRKTAFQTREANEEFCPHLGSFVCDNTLHSRCSLSDWSPKYPAVPSCVLSVLTAIKGSQVKRICRGCWNADDRRLASNPGPHRHRICDRREEASSRWSQIRWRWGPGFEANRRPKLEKSLVVLITGRLCIGTFTLRVQALPVFCPIGAIRPAASSEKNAFHCCHRKNYYPCPSEKQGNQSRNVEREKSQTEEVPERAKRLWLRGAWRDRDTNGIFAHCSLIFLLSWFQIFQLCLSFCTSSPDLVLF